MRFRIRAAALVAVMLAATLAAVLPQASAVPNLVATDEASYQAFGRVFPDPHGCLAFGVPDTNGDGVKDTPKGVSPWAKGRVCADQFLQYQEVIDGAKFLERRFPEYLDVIRLDQAYDNPNYMSAGLPRMIVNKDGKVKTWGRDRRPLYLLKVTDSTSSIPEAEREHFAYSLSIHGIERAGIEGGVRAMEDLVTWAACENPKYAAPAAPALAPPACAAEGPFPKKIVESVTTAAVPTAGDVVDKAVIYFVLPNPDGWARGQVSPVEVEDGAPNTSYQPGFFFQRYNGDGVDLNRDFPTLGYSFKPYSPGSEPETKAFTQVLSGIRKSTAAGQFTGGIDLHGMVTAHAFSYTLIGAGQRDFRKNALTVDTSIRTWQDQTSRMSWSPYVADANANGQTDTGETCVGEGLEVPNVFGGGSRGRIPACVADEWGTVIDTIGYQISGGIGDWFDSPLGLNGIGIDNEMFASHLAPNTVFEPGLEQTHIDGNKGLIYSQLSSLLTANETTFTPTGRVGYVYNPSRLQIEGGQRPTNPGLPAQNDIEATLPCQSVAAQNAEGSCGAGIFTPGSAPSFEFQVMGPEEGVFNAGVIAQYTGTNVSGVGAANAGAMQLQHFDEGQWQTVAYHYRQGGGTTNPGSAGADLYAPVGQVVSIDDPKPGRYRIYFANAAELPGRLEIDFRHETAEANPGQVPINASSMDFFDEINEYVPAGSKLEKVSIGKVVAGDPSLSSLDSLIVVNSAGDRSFLVNQLGLTDAEATTYFNNLKGFAQQGGNLVLTDAALLAASEIGLVPAEDVKQIYSSSETTAGNYAFQIGTGNITYNDPARYPLTADIKKPGAAEQEAGRRQAVEPTPLGYSPDYGLDSDPKLPAWGITKASWAGSCGLADCVSAVMQSSGTAAYRDANLGEARLGQGTVRIAGILFPDPIFEPDADKNDARFGLADYALTYTGYDVFENLIDYKRP
jgi:zinc carboxypeptidase